MFLLYHKISYQNVVSATVILVSGAIYINLCRNRGYIPKFCHFRIFQPFNISLGNFSVNDLCSFAMLLAVPKERPENFWPEQDSNPDLCDASVVLNQLSYQANWELVIMWVHDKPIESG